MHESANKNIKKRISKAIDNYDFEKQKKSNIRGCICYKQNKKCHDIENLNCFFCYCPNYDRNVKEGKCKIDSPKGKYIDNPGGQILDCSDCDFPHTKENAIELLEGLFR